MALTPEDVVNKRFQPTKFREGYDQDEVDDFLDEVVVELRRLNQENEELRERLAASEARVNELQRSASSAPTPVPAPSAASEPVPAPVPAPAAVTPATAAHAQASAEAIENTSTNNLLQLARRLHDEHVREGVEKRDALIAEGHATAARVVAEAEAKQRAQLTALDQERTALERRIEELRTFERDYRQKLRSYIEGQLRELDGAAPVDAGQAPGSTSGQIQPPAAPQPAPVAAPFGSAPTPPPAGYPGFGGGA